MTKIEKHLAALAEKINREHRAFTETASKALEHAIRAGELLAGVKAELPHGSFGPWVAANFDGSHRTAQDYMRMYRHRDELREKAQHAADLSIRGALAELTAPKAEPSGGREYPTNVDSRAVAHVEKWIADMRTVVAKGLSDKPDDIRQKSGEVPQGLAQLRESERRMYKGLEQVADGTEKALEGIQAMYEGGWPRKARGLLRETIIVNSIHQTSYREALYDAREMLLEFLAAKQAISSTPYLARITERIEERMNHHWDTVPMHLALEEKHLLQDVYPAALDRIGEEWDKDADIEMALEELEEVTCPADLLPSRERGGYFEHLTEEQLHTPFAELRRSGELYEAMGRA